jgi:hypothetical protein
MAKERKPTTAVGFVRPGGKWVWRRVQRSKGKVFVGFAQRGLHPTQRTKGLWWGETEGGSILTLNGGFVAYVVADKDGAKKMRLYLKVLTDPAKLRRMKKAGVIK